MSAQPWCSLCGVELERRPGRPRRYCPRCALAAGQLARAASGLRDLPEADWERAILLLRAYRAGQREGA